MPAMPAGNTPAFSPRILAYLLIAIVIGIVSYDWYRKQFAAPADGDEQEQRQDDADDDAAAASLEELLAAKDYTALLKAAEAQRGGHQQAELYRARALVGLDKVDDAVFAYQDYIASLSEPDAAVLYELMKTLAMSSKPEAQLKTAETILALPNDINNGAARLSAVLTLSAFHESKDDLVEARRILSKLMHDKPDGVDLTDIRARLKILNQDLFFSQLEAQGGTYYEVQSGDTLDKIGAPHKVPGALLARINKTDPRRIQVGQRIKIVEGPLAVRVDLKRLVLEVWQGDHYICEYPVGLGKDQGTPSGTFFVKEKIKNPNYEPIGKPKVTFAQGSPLGTRWIEFTDANGVLKHYGIHGTNKPDSIGKNESAGCIRMLNADVEWVFDMLTREHSKITIR